MGDTGPSYRRTLRGTAPVVGSFYFEDLLEQELGHTHHCHMQLRRIEIAKRKLRLSQEPLCQIVRELGFPSVQYFGFLFKKMTGLSPASIKE